MTTAKLGDVAEFINGFPFKPEDWHERGLPIVRIQNLTDPSKPINATTRRVPDRFQVTRGELLVSWSATLGVFVWDRTDQALVNQHIFRVVPTSQVDQGFLRHMLEGALVSMERHLHGATMKHVNRGEFLSTEIPLPPLDEQRRIAAILDHVATIRTKRRKVVAHLDSLTESIFYATFGDPESWPSRWPMGTIGGMAESVQYGSSAKAGPDGQWPMLRMGNVTDSGRLDLTDLKFVDLAESEIPKYTVRRGDMLFNRTNSKEKVGKSCVVDTDTPLAVAGYLVRVRLKPEHRSEFVSSYLRSKHGLGVRQRIARAAVNQANINASEMRRIPIAHPPTALQATFAQRVDLVNAQRTAVLAAQAADDELFVSLQSRAFRGEL